MSSKALGWVVVALAGVGLSGCDSAQAFEGALQEPGTTLGINAGGNGPGRGRHGRGEGMGPGQEHGCQGQCDGNCDGHGRTPDPLDLPECRMMAMQGGEARGNRGHHGRGGGGPMGGPHFPGMCPPPEDGTPPPPPPAPPAGEGPVTGPDGRPLPPFAFIYDVNDDRVLQDSERTAMQADMATRCQARQALMLSRYDVNKDGALDDAEKTAARDALRSTAEAWVAAHDTDGNGCLDPAEHHAVMDAQRQADLAQFDANHDGTLDAAEKTALRAALRERFLSGLMPFER